MISNLFQWLFHWHSAFLLSWPFSLVSQNASFSPPSGGCKCCCFCLTYSPFLTPSSFSNQLKHHFCRAVYYCFLYTHQTVRILRGGPISGFYFVKILFISFEREGKGRSKKERNINVWLPPSHPPLGTRPTTQACVLTGNWTSDPLVHRPALNPLSHDSQAPYLFCSLLPSLTSS